MQTGKLGFDLCQVGFSAFHIFLRFHQEDFLLLIVLFDVLGQVVLPVFQHFDHEFQLLVELGQRTVLLLLQLLLNLGHIVLKNIRFSDRGLDFVRQNIPLFDQGVHFLVVFLLFVADTMPLVLSNDTLRANVRQAILTKILRLLLWMLQTKLLDHVLVSVGCRRCLGTIRWDLPIVSMQLRGDAREPTIVFPLVVNIVEYRKILDQLLDLRREELPASRTCKDV